jgi:hypothetical protein
VRFRPWAPCSQFPSVGFFVGFSFFFPPFFGVQLFGGVFFFGGFFGVLLTRFRRRWCAVFGWKAVGAVQRERSVDFRELKWKLRLECVLSSWACGRSGVDGGILAPEVGSASLRIGIWK